MPTCQTEAGAASRGAVGPEWLRVPRSGPRVGPDGCGHAPVGGVLEACRVGERRAEWAEEGRWAPPCRGGEMAPRALLNPRARFRCALRQGGIGGTIPLLPVGPQPASDRSSAIVEVAVRFSDFQVHPETHNQHKKSGSRRSRCCRTKKRLYFFGCHDLKVPTVSLLSGRRLSMPS